MNLDLSKFKKIIDEKDVAVLAHPDGHKIEIAKSVLNKKYSKDLNKLPLHMANGGLVDEEEKKRKELSISPDISMMGPKLPEGIQGLPRLWLENPDVSPEIKSSILKTYEQNQALLEAKRAGEQERANAEAQLKRKRAEEYNQFASRYGLSPAPIPDTAPVGPVAQVADAGGGVGLGGSMSGSPTTNISGESVITSRQKPSPMDDYSGLMTQGAQSGLLGFQKEAQALGDLGKKQADIYQQEIEQQQKLNDDINARMAQFDAENKKLMESIQSGQIDPTRFLSSMGTGQKVALNIGLLLGGIGAGMTGGQNLAFQMLQKNIDNDIDAQRAELGKKQTLLSYNLQHFGNMKDAMLMTKAQLSAITANKIAQAGAMAQDPIAKARAMQASAEFLNKNNEIFRTIATNQATNEALSSGAAKGDPISLIKLKVPEAQQPKYFEELQKARNAQNALTLAENAYEEMKQMSRVGALIPGTDAKTAWNAKKEEIAINLAEALGEKAEKLKKSIEALLPERLFEADSEIELKKKSMRNLLQRNMNFPLLESIGANTFSKQMIRERAPQVK